MGVTVGVSVTDGVRVIVGVRVMVGVSVIDGVMVAVGVSVAVGVGGKKLYATGSAYRFKRKARMPVTRSAPGRSWRKGPPRRGQLKGVTVLACQAASEFTLSWSPACCGFCLCSRLCLMRLRFRP